MMNTLREAIQKLMETKPSKLVLSIPAQGETPYQRVVVRWMEAGYQIESYTEKQVFHKNIPAEELGDFCLEALEIFPAAERLGGGLRNGGADHAERESAL